MPVSATRSSTRLAVDRRAGRRTRPPATVYLIALETRLSTTCAIRCGSRLIANEPGARASRSTPARSAAGPGRLDAARARSRRGRSRCGRRASAPSSTLRGVRAGRRPAGRAARCCGRRPRAGRRRRAGRSGALLEDVDVADDRGERRAQLVGDRGDELVLDLQRAHELRDVLVGERGAGELTPSSRTDRADTDSARRVSGSAPIQIRQSSNSSPLAGAVGRHLARAPAGVTPSSANTWPTWPARPAWPRG